MKTRSRARCETAQTIGNKIKIEDCEPDSVYGQADAGASLVADVIKTEPDDYLKQLNSLLHTANGRTQAPGEVKDEIMDDEEYSRPGPSNAHIASIPKREELEAFDWNTGQCPFCPLNFAMDSLLHEHLKECRPTLEARNVSGRRQYVPPKTYSIRDKVHGSTGSHTVSEKWMNLMRKKALESSVAQQLTFYCHYCPRTSHSLVGIASHEKTCKNIDPIQRIARAQIAATAKAIATVKWIRPNDKVLKKREKKCPECRETLLDTPGGNAAHKTRCKKQTQLTPRLTDAQDVRHDPWAWKSEDHNWRPCKYCEAPFDVKGVVSHEKVCCKLSPAVRERSKMLRNDERRMLARQPVPDVSNQIGLATLLNSIMGCPYCEQTIGPFYLMDRHIQTMHNRRVFFHCTACLVTYITIKQFETHWHSRKFCQNHGKIELRGDESLEPPTVPSQKNAK